MLKRDFSRKEKERERETFSGESGFCRSLIIASSTREINVFAVSFSVAVAFKGSTGVGVYTVRHLAAALFHKRP